MPKRFSNAKLRLNRRCVRTKSVTALWRWPRTRSSGARTRPETTYGPLRIGSGLAEHKMTTLSALGGSTSSIRRSEEHTSELQSRRDLVCRLLLEKKKKGI